MFVAVLLSIGTLIWYSAVKSRIFFLEEEIAGGGGVVYYADLEDHRIPTPFL